ncbi:DUF2971 domain-containing protein [Vreelandella neptunia]|uniref:DUF2971 domain-containing protein n=1 Tax=Vreelandella neptunia TaxID=115551 RepID=UPI0031599A1F|tara:strand:- start:552 stop:1145 length:594 start_codon:yes stop_codon:yes gene_type:complete
MEKKYALENVKKSRIKVATLRNMNDPYEFYIRFEGAREEEIDRFKAHFNKIAGFLCFSRRLGDPLQWAHYADNHKGICFEFEIPDRLLLKINYLKSPVQISVKSFDWKRDLVQTTLCKYRGWSYERERRVLVNLKEEGVTQEGELFFAQFSKGVVPSKVYTGIRCELTAEEEALFKGNELPVYKMAQDANSYSIVHA